MAELQTVVGTAARTAAPVDALAQGAKDTKRTQGEAPAVPDPEQRIREVAYSFFVERGYVEGHDVDDWLKAESQMQQSRVAGGTPVEH